MAKKKDVTKCELCGFRVALCFLDMDDNSETSANFDQEPYDAGVIEPVIIKGQELESVQLIGRYICHICPKCGWVRDIDIDRD